MTREVPLTRGYVALVDDEDFERVAAKKWTALVRPRRVSAQHYWREGPKVKGVGLGPFIMEPPPGMQVDHANGDPLDNRRCNLRICTPEQNMQNRRTPLRAQRSTPFKGVQQVPSGRYRALVFANGREHWAGTHDTAEGAARAYDAKALEVHGEFARLNFPTERTHSGALSIAEWASETQRRLRAK